MLEPSFTFHGFRYAEVETDAELLDAEVVAISSDTPPRGAFALLATRRSTGSTRTCVWSQRDNFVSVPTDCPQRDERLGWTGDAQAFAPTASHAVRLASRSGRAGCATWRSTRPTMLGVPSGRARTSCVDGEPAIGPGRLGRRGDDRAVGGLRVLRRPEVLARAAAEHARAGSSSLRRAAATDGLLGRRVPVRRLAGPGRAGRPAVGGQGRLRLPRQRLLRPQRPAGRPTRRGCSATPARPPTTTRLADEVAARTWARWRRPRAHDPDRLRRRARVRHRARPSERPRSATRSRRWSARPTAGSRPGFLGTPLVLPALADTGSPRRGVPDAAAPRAAVVAVPGRPGRDDRLGALGRDPARRLDPRRADDAARARAHDGQEPTCCRSTTTPTAR